MGIGLIFEEVFLKVIDLLEIDFGVQVSFLLVNDDQLSDQELVVVFKLLIDL